MEVYRKIKLTLPCIVQNVCRMWLACLALLTNWPALLVGLCFSFVDFCQAVSFSLLPHTQASCAAGVPAVVCHGLSLRLRHVLTEFNQGPALNHQQLLRYVKRVF